LFHFIIAALLVANGCSNEEITRAVDDTQPPNEPPQVVECVPENASPEIVLGETLRFSILAADPNDDELTCQYTVDEVVVGTNMQFDYTANKEGTVCVCAVISDGEFEVEHNWFATVSDTVTNLAPEFIETLPVENSLNATVGDTVAFSVVAMDPNGDELAYEFLVDDTVVGGDSLYDYIADAEGLFRINAGVTDGELSTSHEWALTVVPANRPPELLSTTPADAAPNVIVGETVRFSVVASDADGDDLEYAFYADDNAVSQNDFYDHLVDEVGTVIVRAVVSDGELFVDHEWLLTAHPDDLPPAQVQITTVQPGPNLREIEARWLAVGDDGLNGRASGYIVAISNTYIDDSSDWALAGKHTIDGSVVDAGTEMHLVIARNSAAQYTAVTVRAIDDAGNLSALGPCVEGYTRGYSYTGEVRDASTGLPIAGAIVRSGGATVASGPNGAWSMNDLPAVITELTISDDDVPGSIGDYYDVQLDDPDDNTYHFVISLIPHRTMQSTIHPDFLQFFDGLTEMYLYKWPSYLRHFDLPINVYVEPFEKNGLDYKATIEGVVESLGADIGFEVFRVVDTPPAVGIFCVYRDDIVYDNWIPTEWTEDFHLVKGRVTFRTIYSPTSQEFFERVIRHELGHGLGLDHSQDPIHLMLGGAGVPRVDRFTQDEINILDIIYNYSGYEVDFGCFVRE
jgi:hypothetical protein